MNYPLDFASKKMAERGVENYTTQTVLIQVPAGTEKVIHQTNDYNLLVNFFTQSAVPSGILEAENDLVNLNPAMSNTKFYKYRFLIGDITITNKSATEDLFVEFLRLTPEF